MLLLFKSRNCRVKLPWLFIADDLRRADAVVGQFFLAGIWVIWVSSHLTALSKPAVLFHSDWLSSMGWAVPEGCNRWPRADIVRIFLNVMTPELGSTV